MQVLCSKEFRGDDKEYFKGKKIQKLYMNFFFMLTEQSVKINDVFKSRSKSSVDRDRHANARLSVREFVNLCTVLHIKAAQVAYPRALLLSK